MPVTVPTLDDLGYAELLAGATAKIPAIDPEWTDHSPTEPGMVLLELLCWLTESAIWRLDQVSPEVLTALLELLDPRDPRTLLATLAPADLEDRIVATRQRLRAPHRAVTPDDFRRLLAARWPARTFTVHAGKNLDAADPAAPGHVSLVATPATRQWVTRVRLAPGATAWLLHVERPGPVRVAICEDLGGDRFEELHVIVDSASETEHSHGRPWTVVIDPPSVTPRTCALLGPEGRLRARVTIPATPLTLSLEADEQLLDHEPIASPDGDHARCVVRLHAPRLAGFTVRLWSSSAVTVSTSDAPDGVSDPRNAHEHISSHAGDVLAPFVLTLDRPVDLVVALERREDAPLLAGELRDFLEPRILLGTRLHFPPIVEVPITVDAALRLRDGADPAAVHGVALERLERLFRALNDDGPTSPLRAVRKVQLYALLAGIDGVESVERLADPPGAQAGVRALGPCEVATLASSLSITLERRKRATENEWEVVEP